MTKLVKNSTKSVKRFDKAPNLEVEVKPNFGKTGFLYEALKSGSIDIYPEYTGTVAANLLQPALENLPSDARRVYELAREGIYAQDGLVYLEPCQFQNTYALAVRRAYAREKGLSSISDLAPVASGLTAGFTLEFHDRKDGHQGLKNLYGLDLAVKTMEPSLRYQAIAAGDVDVVDVYSTDSKIRTHDLVVLEDDKQLFPPYQAGPLLRQETLEAYPLLEEILSVLSGRITSQEMTELNYRVEVEGRNAQDVAREYLEAEGLLP